VPAVSPEIQRVILHIDMDAFFASVEVHDNPSLVGKAVIVGGDGARGVVASCSYEARAFGVRSAMSSIEAKRRCPHAVFVSGRHARYGEISEQIHAVFSEVTPIVEPISLDEAFLDVTGAVRRLGSGPTIAAQIRSSILAATGLSSSVGIATSKLVAKLASEAAKPHVERLSGTVRQVRISLRNPSSPAIIGAVCRSIGVVEVVAGSEVEFLHAHHARSLWGVGPATMERLARFGVVTVGDIAELPRETLVRAVGASAGNHLHQLSHGIDRRFVVADRQTKSVGHEETFSVDVNDVGQLHIEVIRMADAVGRRLKRAGLSGRTVTLKLKWPDFSLTTRSVTLREPVDGGSAIADAADRLLRNESLSHRIATDGVRLLGVTVASLQTNHASLQTNDASPAAGPVLPSRLSGDDGGSLPQLSLFDDAPSEVVADSRSKARPVSSSEARSQASARLDDIVAAIRDRFGDSAVAPASLLQDGHVRVRTDQLDNPWDASGASDHTKK
jgi:DNA polymerase IV